MTITISYEQQRFFVMDLSRPSLLVHIYGDVRWPSPFHIWWGSKNVTIRSFVRVEKCHHKFIGDGQKILCRHSILIRAWWNRTTNLMLLKQVLFHWVSTLLRTRLYKIKPWKFINSNLYNFWEIIKNCKVLVNLY